MPVKKVNLNPLLAPNVVAFHRLETLKVIHDLKMRLVDAIVQDLDHLQDAEITTIVAEVAVEAVQEVLIGMFCVLSSNLISNFSRDHHRRERSDRNVVSSSAPTTRIRCRDYEGSTYLFLSCCLTAIT